MLYWLKWTRINTFPFRTYGNPHDFNFNEIVKELVYFKGLSFYTLQMCGPNATQKHDDCSKTDFIAFPAEVGILRPVYTGADKREHNWYWHLATLQNYSNFGTIDLLFFRFYDNVEAVQMGLNESGVSGNISKWFAF